MFFCKSEQIGLIDARDIIRTLAYQISFAVSAFKAGLDALEKADFEISPSIDLHFLFIKILKEPLQRCTKDVYIVLNGLNEVDNTTRDLDENTKPEMEVLIEYFTNPPFTRLLLLSGTESAISRIIPRSRIKNISSEKNVNDIRTYAKNEIEKLKIVIK